MVEKLVNEENLGRCKYFFTEHIFFNYNIFIENRILINWKQLEFYFPAFKIVLSISGNDQKYLDFLPKFCWKFRQHLDILKNIDCKTTG